MKKIPLTQGKFAVVDEADHAEISRFRWFAVRAGSGAFYAARKCDGKRAYMHREIIGQEGLDVDHANGDTLDNRRGNLRLCTRGQNCRNRAAVKGTASGLKGVHWDAGSKKFRCSIRVNGKLIHAGMFSNKVAAAMLYDFLARLKFGEFARTNFGFFYWEGGRVRGRPPIIFGQKS